MLKAYINGIGIISPQKTFDSVGFPNEIVNFDETLSMKCIEPVYNQFLDPMSSRRMSRIVKMGLCAALRCLQNSGVEMPGAIITGTGFGCIEDTEKFLGSIFTNEEKLLNPTPFIQSTHNTIGAAIALKLKCNNYNSTYVHRSFSFEHALLDAMMLIKDGESNDILIGGLDETTPDYFTIKNRIGCWKSEPVNNLMLKESKTKGTISGEGVAFFLLGNKKNDKTFAVIKSVKTALKPGGEDDILDFISSSGILQNEVDLVLYGINGDVEHDEIYYNLTNGKFKHTPTGYYKHLCGEYDTSASFALWLASVILKEQSVPEIVKLTPFDIEKINNILIFNHLKDNGHSLMLVSKC